MTEFDPEPGVPFTVALRGRNLVFSAVPSPAMPAFAFAAEGAKAVVYQITTPHGDLYALKQMKPVFRESSVAASCRQLAPYQHMPGLRVCDRLCFDPVEAPQVVATWPDLQYAILMYWIRGLTWNDVRATQGRQWPEGQDDTPAGHENRIALAADLAARLAALEAAGLAHCDLSPGNLLFDPTTGLAELIDVEDMYGPRPLSRPSHPSQGSPGYQHRQFADAAIDPWRPAADRFAAALLFAEILTLHDPGVWRASAGVDSYFLPAETLAADPSNPRYIALRGALLSVGNGSAFTGLLDQAWLARTLEQCPTLAEWDKRLAPWRSPQTVRALADASQRARVDLAAPASPLRQRLFGARSGDCGGADTSGTLASGPRIGGFHPLPPDAAAPRITDMVPVEAAAAGPTVTAWRPLIAGPVVSGWRSPSDSMAGPAGCAPDSSANSGRTVDGTVSASAADAPSADDLRSLSATNDTSASGSFASRGYEADANNNEPTPPRRTGS